MLKGFKQFTLKVNDCGKTLGTILAIEYSLDSALPTGSNYSFDFSLDTVRKIKISLLVGNYFDFF